jgi:hypothetical protein
MPRTYYEKPSMLTRIAVGKGIGLLIGLAAFFTLPELWPDATTNFRWGILFWYTTLGAVIAVFGVLNWHPVLRLPVPWWLRAPLVGGWMNFVLTFFAYEPLEQTTIAIMGTAASPFWFVLEGAIVGAVIGGVATWLGGEGRATAEILNDRNP